MFKIRLFKVLFPPLSFCSRRDNNAPIRVQPQLFKVFINQWIPNLSENLIGWLPSQSYQPGSRTLERYLQHKLSHHEKEQNVKWYQLVHGVSVSLVNNRTFLYISDYKSIKRQYYWLFGSLIYIWHKSQLNMSKLTTSNNFALFTISCTMEVLSNAPDRKSS